MNKELAYYYWKRNNWMFSFLFHYGLAKVSIKKPIFLLGNQGDGITFISRILRRHHQIVSISGNHNYWTGADEMATVMEPYLPPSFRLSGRILKTDPPHEYLSQPRSWSYASDDLVEAYHQTEVDLPESHSIRFINAIALALKRFGNKNSRFVDKSQVYTLKTRLIQESLKNSEPYFVLFTRNPFISCFRAASGKAGDMKRYAAFLDFDKRFEISLQHWKNSIETVLEDAEKLKYFKTYQFEHFLADIKTSTIDLCNFLDLDFDSDMLPAQNQSIPFGTKYRMRWFPVNPDVNKKYESKIEKKYFDWVEDYLGTLANKLGYFHPLK